MGYNAYNLPTSIATEEAGHTFTYTAGGNLFMRESSTEAGTEKRYYIEELEIVDDEIILQKMAEGRVIFEGDDANDTNEPESRYQYSLTDHLGNTMVLFEDRDNNGIITESPNPTTSEVLQRELYYPFGLQFRGTAPLAAEPAQNYLYNGKEQMEGTGLYAYGFRYYDPVIGRWTGVDPLAHQFGAWSQYNYVFNSPLRHIDPDGAAPDDIILRNIRGCTDCISRFVNVINNNYRGVFKASVSEVQTTVNFPIMGDITFTDYKSMVRCDLSSPKP